MALGRGVESAVLNIEANDFLLLLRKIEKDATPEDLATVRSILSFFANKAIEVSTDREDKNPLIPKLKTILTETQDSNVCDFIKKMEEFCKENSTNIVNDLQYRLPSNTEKYLSDMPTIYETALTVDGEPIIVKL